MQLSDLAGRRVAVWGPGVEGLALAEAAIRRAAPSRLLFLADEPGAVDPAARAEVAAYGAELAPLKAGWDGIDVLVHTAGVSRYRPEIVEAARCGVALTTPTALWFADHAGRRVVAVTGTKGKSTTAGLIRHLVAGLGQRAVFAGNVGDPLGSLYGEDDPSLRFVVELSSHQTADLDTSPELAVVTNLSPDHLPWHRNDVETYYRDKLNLLAHRASMVSVLNAADPELAARAASAPHPAWFGKPPGYRATDQGIAGPGGPVVAAGDLRLRGRFNLDNCCAALAAVAAWGLRAPVDRLGELLGSFEPLPGRLEAVGSVSGVLFVDDALASNPAGAVAAVEAFPDVPLTLIVGGADRNVGFAGLAACLAAHSAEVRLVTVPDNGGDIAAAVRRVRPEAPVAAAVDVAEAVAAAAGLTEPGGVVLFAPAAPTPVRLGSYRNRSRDFHAAVEGLASHS